MSNSAPVKIGAVGGRRAMAYYEAAVHLADQVRFTAVCDLDPAVLNRWSERDPSIQTFIQYEDMLRRGDCDAILIATPPELHAAQAIQAIQAGKHALSEVPAILSLDEGWALIEAVRESDRVYMMAENYCYMRTNRMVLNMARQGLFGDLIYAEGAYIHDCRNLLFTPQGELTWRGRYRREDDGNSYPTHSLGPVAQWLEINRSDRLESLATWTTREESAHLFAAEVLGRDHPAAQPGYFLHGDSATTVIRTERGAIIVLRVDWVSPRPHNMTHYVLQGSRGAYLSPRHAGEDPLVWIEGLSPGASPPSPEKGEAEWEPLWRYANQYEDEAWRQWGEMATRAGHGGGDLLVLIDFIKAVTEGTSPPIDVYDAVTWSAVIPLSQESVRRGGAPVPVPDFLARFERR
ncbi:MAG: Gfo/Idh/MocA family oxidoreductase [Anaerolineae bacterium]|nr:Gfo/Idh/MocA family oxidoreductase [Anaerolineae bacterium]